MGRKPVVEYRHYEMPAGTYVFALYGAGWVRRYGDDRTNLHFHNYLEIGMCLNGTGRMVFDREGFPYGPGDFTIIPARFPHNTISAKGKYSAWEYLFVDSTSLIRLMTENRALASSRMENLMQGGAYLLKESDNPLLYKEIQQVFQLQKEKPEYYQMESNAILSTVCILVIRMNESSGKEMRPAAEESALVRPAIAYAQEHYREQIRVSDLADACWLSESNFRAVFQEHMNMPPMDYVNSVRIHSACKLLSTSNESIHAIAAKCGFRSMATFNRNFRKFVGTTGEKWRKDPSNYLAGIRASHVDVFDGWE